MVFRAESRRPVVLHVAQPEYRVAEKPNLRRRLISTEKAALLSNDLAGSELATKTIIAKQLIGSDACLQQLGIDVQVSRCVRKQLSVQYILSTYMCTGQASLAASRSTSIACMDVHV